MKESMLLARIPEVFAHASFVCPLCGRVGEVDIDENVVYHDTSHCECFDYFTLEQPPEAAAEGIIELWGEFWG